MLLNHIDTFNISSQQYITTDCDEIELSRIQNINEIKEYWKEGYKTSNNIHYIDIKTFNDITYKLSVVLTDKVIDFMEYSSDFTTKNSNNFLSNLCRLLEKIQYVVTEMCKNLKEIYVLQIATISISTSGITTLLAERSNQYESENHIFDDILKDIRCMYIYLDQLTIDDAIQNGLSSNTIQSESICDICPFKDLHGLSTPHGRNYCDIRDMPCIGGTSSLPSNINALSDVYHFNPENEYSTYTFRPYDSIVLVHEFAHNIMENGIANGDRDKRIEFNDIYDEYKSFVDSNDNKQCIKMDGTSHNCPNCSEIYACYGNCVDSSCDFKGRELFAISSETWFGVNLESINSNIFIKTTDNIFTYFPKLYFYLSSIYGPPNNLCQNSTILEHYEICNIANQNMLLSKINQCNDNQNFRDSYGQSCDIWNNDDFYCDRAEIHGYTEEQKNDIKLNCPMSCEICSESIPDITASVSSGSNDLILSFAISFLAFLTGITGATACASRRNTQNEYANLKCGDIPGEV